MVTMIRCAPWISAGAGDEALVLFHENDGSYHALNGSASIVWRLLAEGLQAAEIVAALVATYGIEPAVASQDVAAFIEAALAKGLVIEDDSEAKPAANRSESAP